MRLVNKGLLKIHQGGLLAEFNLSSFLYKKLDICVYSW